MSETLRNKLVFAPQVTEDVYRLITDCYDFECRGQVSVKGKGQMLTYFLKGRRPGSRPAPPQQQQNSERRLSAFSHGSVCTRLSPAPTVTTYASIRTSSPGTTKPIASSSTTRYLPSVPMAMVWGICFYGNYGAKGEWRKEETELLHSFSTLGGETLFVQ